MGKKSPGKPPTPPDPNAIAAAQTQSNIDTVKFSTDLNRLDEVTPFGNVSFAPIEGTDRFRRTETLSPGGQRSLDNELAISNAASGLGLANFQNVANAQSQPFNLQGIPGIQSNIGGGAIQSSAAPSGAIQSGLGEAGQIQGGLDFSGVSGIPGQDDFGADRQRIEDLIFENQSGRLNTRFGQEQATLDQTLANRGLGLNSAASLAERDRFDQSKNDAFQDARISSILTGAQEQGRLFNQGLAARQQGVGEVSQQGQFANQAQQQGFGQNLQAGNFVNQAQQQQFLQNQADVAANNAAQQQQFGQNAANVSLANQSRQQQIQERALLRNQPINELSALLGAAPGVPLPQFSPTFTQNVANTDVAGIQQNAFKNQMENFQARQAQSGGKLGALGGLAGSAIPVVGGLLG